MKKDKYKIVNGIMVKKKTPIRTICGICHGMGVKELPNGDAIDCPNRSCDNGIIKIKNEVNDE